jgi:hypothetical protein
LARKYKQHSVRARIEAFLLDNVGEVVTREQIIEAARDPKTGRDPENWHQRLSELRTDAGYAILSWRDRKDLKVGEYLLENTERRATASKRVGPKPETWRIVLERADYACEWKDGTATCRLKDGDADPVGGGTVKLTPDHKNPHSVSPSSDPNDPGAWQALCGRHQVMKKNYWDDRTGWLNVAAIVQAASKKVKREVYEFLKRYFGEA